MTGNEALIPPTARPGALSAPVKIKPHPVFVLMSTQFLFNFSANAKRPLHDSRGLAG